MNSNDKDDASNTQNPGPLSVAKQHKNTLSDAVKKDTPCRESTVLDNKAAVLSRETSATAREDAAHLREDAVHLRETTVQVREGKAHVREGIATSREQEIRTAEAMQAASDDHLIMLQQANAHLVSATIEAQKMAEQI